MAQPEVPQGITETLKAAAEVMAKAAAEAEKQPKAKATKTRKHDVEKEKDQAKKTVDNLKKGVTPERQSIDEQKATEAREIVVEAKASNQATWLLSEATTIPEDPVLVDVIADLATAPIELQTDPTWLLAKGAKLRYSLKDDATEDQRRDVRKILFAIHRRIGALSGHDMNDPQVRRSSDPHVRRWAEFYEFAGNHLTFEEFGRTATPPQAAPTGESWIDKEPVTDAAGNLVVISDPDLQRGLNEIRALSSGDRWDPINEKFTELRGIRAGLSPGEQEYLDKLWEIASKRFKPGMHGSHWSPTGEEIYELQTSTIARDKKFYDLIHKVLDNPNEEAYKQFDLYDKYNFDQFTDIIGKTMDAQKHLVGDKLRAHYQNLYDTIMRLSDADYWAVHPAGDVEGLQKHMNFFKNSFAIEAISDPIAEQMMSCYEQAAELIRDLHDQYLPNELFAHHAVRYGTYIDDLAEKLFRQRVDAGAVHDAKRHPVTGLPELDDTKGIEGRKVKLDDKPLTLEQLDSDDEAYQLRVKAARRMGKGMGIMTLRFTETLAFTRTPGDHVMTDGINGEFSKKISSFSSKPYGGITRWHNPMSEWMRMYGFGDTLFVPFFNALAGAPPSETRPLLKRIFSREMMRHPLTTVFGKHGQATERALSWSQNQVRDVMNIADTGDKELLERKYGKGVIRLYDTIEEMSFTGRFGPRSMWGTLDSTIEWSDWDRERLGGSMRLSMIEGLAESLIEKEFKEKFESQYAGKEWKRTAELQQAWLKTKIGETSRLNVILGKEGSLEWKKRVEELSRTYKTWVWTQYIMRNPQGAAAHVYVDYGRKPDGKTYRAKLKSKILHEIFKPEDLRPYQVESSIPHFLEGNELIVERDIASARDLTSVQYALMERVRLLDGDLMAVQSYAMNAEGRPRDIKDTDFDQCIKGNITLQEHGITVTIDEATRRDQARKYFKIVQQEFFGKARGEAGPAWSVDQWRTALQPYWVKLDSAGKIVSEVSGPDAANEDHQNLRFRVPEKIDALFKEASDAARGNLRLKEGMVDRKILVHMGTEDVQWRYLDLNVLGERHWGRRGNDFLTSAKTDQLLMETFHMLTADPDMDKLVEQLQKIGMNEKGHDPKEAAKRTYEWALGIANIYRQRKLAAVPFVGRILPSLFNMPMSLAQERFGARIAAAWSVNNLAQYRDKIGKTRIIPARRIIDGKDWGPYTMQQFGRDLGASNVVAIMEMVIIGSTLAAIMTSLLAVSESNKEAKEG